MKGWGIVALLAAGAWLAGCGLGGPGRVEFSDGRQTISCGGMSSGACEEQGGKVAARHPGATVIALDCSAASCNRGGGSGTAVVTLADGTKAADTFAYTGDPGPVPEPQCIGIEARACRNVASGQVDSVAPSKRIVGIEVRCTSASCTEDSGEADVSITLGDGSVQSVLVGWEPAG